MGPYVSLQICQSGEFRDLGGQGHSFSGSLGASKNFLSYLLSVAAELLT